MNDDVKVSICCAVYNQEDYIRKALDSFLMQNTNFKFEIIIHDDASTDNTANIIREYEKKYPDIIKPIYQTVNQYSQHIDIFKIIYEKAIGKYIAICEGDDYWCDEYKLQKQFDFMENHCNCSLVVTGAKILNEYNHKLQVKEHPYKGSRYYSTEEIIMGGGGLFATASMFFKSEFTNFPQFYSIAPIKDYPLTIHLSLCGKVYFMDDITVIYRMNAKGSWTESMQQGDMCQKYEKLVDGLKKMFFEINQQTNCCYNNAIENAILNLEFTLCIYKRDKLKLKDKKFKALYKTGKFVTRIKNLFKIKFTSLYFILKKI